MLSIISPPLAQNVPSQPASQAASRGRPTENSQGSSFGDALEHSRAANAPKTQEGPAAVRLEPVARRKPSRNGDKKDDLLADLQATALLASAPVPLNLASKTSHASPQDDGTASVSMAHLNLAIARSPLPRDTPAVAVPGADTNLLPKSVIADQGITQDTTPLSQQQAKAQAGVDPLVLPQNADPIDPIDAILASAAGGQALDGMRRALVQDPINTERITPFDTRVVTPFDERLDQTAVADPLTSLSTLAFMPAATDRPSAPLGQAPELSVHPVVGGSEWGPALGQQMIRMFTNGHHVAELSLNPAGLGPLKVTLTIGDNQAQALFVSAHEGVRNAIEAALPQLRKTLADHGINLGQTYVGAESQQPPRQGSTFEQPPSARSASAGYPGPDRLDGAAIAEPLFNGLPRAVRRLSAGVDTFA